MLNPVKGNMYNWVTHTWNTCKGLCEFSCNYCYMKRFPQRELHFDEKELRTNLGENNFIFVGSSCDMWSQSIEKEYILKTLEHCNKYPTNTYLFQSKNPSRFLEFKDNFPPKYILGITLETNRTYDVAEISLAPLIHQRVRDFAEINWAKKMVTLEPIMDFDTEEVISLIKQIKPEWINIGADSGNNKLKEPDKEKIMKLIEGLKGITEVKCKNNLKRLLC